MRLRLAELREQQPQARLRQTWIPYNKIATPLKRAILDSEDDQFVKHHGFDWAGIGAAVAKDEKEGKFSMGGSTITQQLAKNLFLSPDKTLWRKGQEAVITVMLEAVMSKRRILEIYLNVVEWGDGVFGCEAAAREYYGVTAAQLDTRQAARLAVMLPNPQVYARGFPPRLVAREKRIAATAHTIAIP